MVKNPAMPSKIVVCLMTLALAACAHHSGGISPGASGASKNAAIARAAAPVAEASGDSAEPSLRNARLHEIDELKAVRFAYDSAYLEPESRAVLVRNAEWLKKNAAVRLQVAGHCDQRGTVEYNLALGQKRAKVVRDYYLTLGIKGNRLATISYGKEKPLCEAAEESCWKTNRRAETLAALAPPVEVSSQ
jgi:peptidoglycan-associated lipoprotein